MRRFVSIVIAIVCIAAPLFAQDDPDGKLDPEQGVGGAPPFDENNLEQYQPGMLVAFLEVFQNTPGREGTAAKIANYLSKIDPNWRRPDPPAPPTSGTTTQPRSRFRSRNERRPAGGSGTGTGTATATPPAGGDDPPASTTPPRPTTPPATTPPEQTPTPTPTERARTEPDPATAGTGTGAPPPARTPPNTRWFEEAQVQMQEYWAGAPGAPGTLGRGTIYDPRTGAVVSTEEYTRKEGLAEAIDAELANRQSGMGTQKRIKDQ